MRSGETASCGCLANDILLKRNTKHGKSYTSIYATWATMVDRCTKPGFKYYKDYGGRGISVCERWMNFEDFYADMGERPSSAYSLERIDNDGNYEPQNVKWATDMEQGANKRNNVFVWVKGERKHVAEAVRLTGIDANKLYREAKKGRVEID